MAARMYGYRAGAGRRPERGGVVGSSVGECLSPWLPDRLTLDGASAIKKIGQSGTFAAEMMRNLAHCLVVAFRLRTRRPGERIWEIIPRSRYSLSDLF